MEWTVTCIIAAGPVCCPALRSGVIINGRSGPCQYILCKIGENTQDMVATFSVFLREVVEKIVEKALDSGQIPITVNPARAAVPGVGHQI